MIDILVAGGGPAGLAAAIRAAQAGLEAVVVEPRTAPVDKACGEGIMPGGVAALRDLGVRVTGHELRGIRYTDGRRSAEAAFRGGPGADGSDSVHTTSLSAGSRLRVTPLAT
ncbi:FAD-dependent oxidoreductase, partial [Streptomyces griseus]|uniref:FAD-dependent oxidoreductase n=1 Tax=Streptomyces griseus TaxID=1911 RepID=UPI0033E21D55